MKQLETFAESFINYGIWEFDLCTQELKWSKGMYELLEIPLDTITLPDFFEFIHPEDMPTVLEVTNKAQEEKCIQPPIQFRIITATKNLKWVKGIGINEYNNEGQIIKLKGILHDITEFKVTADELLLSQKRLNAALESANIGIWEWDLKANEFTWHEQMYKIFEQNTTFIPTEKSTKKIIHPDDLKLINEKIEKSLSSHPEPFEVEYRIFAKDGSIRWIHDRGQAERDTDNEPIKFRGAVTDITDKKLSDLYLKQMQRLDALGELAAGVAHNLNNNLSPIYILLEKLLQSNSQEERADTINKIEACTKKASELVQQITTFAKGYKARTSTFFLSDLLSDLVNILKKTFPASIGIELEIDPKERYYELNGNESELYQSLLNLCINARDAMEQNGNIRLTAIIYNKSQLRNLLNFSPQLKNSRYIVIHIEDNGKGMDSKTLEQIFDPFFTTKKEGTGLGLSHTYTVIQQMNGLIHANSTPGKGTEFFICLPVYLKHQSHLTSQDLQELDPQEDIERQLQVLLVEDEEIVRETLSEYLQSKGMNVHTAVNGTEGITTFVNHSSQLDLVITDYNMPDINGLKFIEAIQKINPEIRIILSSGYIPEETKDAISKISHLNILEKPFKTKVLVDLIQSICKP